MLHIPLVATSHVLDQPLTPAPPVPSHLSISSQDLLSYHLVGHLWYPHSPSDTCKTVSAQELTTSGTTLDQQGMRTRR